MHVCEQVHVHVASVLCLPRLLSTLLFQIWDPSEPGSPSVGEAGWPANLWDPCSCFSSQALEQQGDLNTGPQACIDH